VVSHEGTQAGTKGEAEGEGKGEDAQARQELGKDI